MEARAYYVGINSPWIKSRKAIKMPIALINVVHQREDGTNIQSQEQQLCVQIIIQKTDGKRRRDGDTNQTIVLAAARKGRPADQTGTVAG